MASGTITKPMSFTTIEQTVSVSFSAGTVGTRGQQTQLTDLAPNGKVIIGTAVTYISNSNKFYPVLFTTGSQLYVNIYRATDEAVSGESVSIRFTFAAI